MSTRSSRRRFRFRRWMAPVAVLLVLFTGTIVTWAMQRVTPGDAQFLEPASRAGIGAATAAHRLAATGVPVRRVGGSAAALSAATGGATLLVTAPGYLRPARLGRLLAPGRYRRVVLVAPSPTVLDEQRLPARRTGSRWTTGVADAGCSGGPAVGPAAVRGDTYAATAPGARRCYAGGVLLLPAAGGPQVVLVGAADVFRNDRIAEHRNAALAAALLGTRPVVWLSLHRPEPVEQVQLPPPAPTASPDRPEPSVTAGTTAPSATAGDGSARAGGGSSGGGSPPNPLWSALPPWVWAIVVQLLVAAALFAGWRARRLGGPVGEPLPVLVPSTETVLGRARLYRRAHAREAAAAALRAGTLRRLRAGLGATAEASSPVALATASGWPVGRVESVLYGPAPERDDDLRALAADLAELRRRVLDPRYGPAKEETRRAGHR
ncbi:hypothetical protein Athai_08210 [Actinocatenispora thailandica]|uniref:DUF4350 domain-containing protein n=1 Tax=Actinocatenispora thailandica TaxID=227318 RepID=A0A7R7HV42_9ACTN|nr:DUF4350 domain-containing protein [Actinocatenispora thailandica]BCJ33318.1 hypothetical protein Athai_08210 [Actinocatenispora thailandica]